MLMKCSSSTTYWLSIYYVLSAVDALVRKTDKNSCHHGVHIIMGGIIVMNVVHKQLRRC